MKRIKKNIYSIILGIILALIFGAAHIDSCNRKRAESGLILNIDHTVYSESFQIEEKKQVIEPITIELKEAKYTDPDIPVEVQEAAIKYGEEYGILPEFLEALAWRESRYHADAVSPDGSCIGLCQINPKWHQERMKRTGKTDLYNIDDNMNVAADYLSELLQEHPGEPEIALMIYNGDHSYREGNISQYAQDIMKKRKSLRKNTEGEKEHERNDTSKSQFAIPRDDKEDLEQSG